MQPIARRLIGEAPPLKVPRALEKQLPFQSKQTIKRNPEKKLSEREKLMKRVVVREGKDKQVNVQVDCFLKNLFSSMWRFNLLVLCSTVILTARYSGLATWLHVYISQNDLDTFSNHFFYRYRSV